MPVGLREAAHELGRSGPSRSRGRPGTPRRRPPGWRADPRDGHGRAADQPARDVDAVGADVVERAAAELGPAADVAGSRTVNVKTARTVRAARRSRSSESSRRTRAPIAGWKRYMNASIHTTPRSTQWSIMSRRLGGVDRRGLLAQHVLSGVGGPLRPLRVQMVRQRDVDRIDVADRQAAPRRSRAGGRRARPRAGTTHRLRPSSPIATSSALSARRIDGITTLRPMFAALITPIRTFAIRHPLAVGRGS